MNLSGFIFLPGGHDLVGGSASEEASNQNVAIDKERLPFPPQRSRIPKSVPMKTPKCCKNLSWKPGGQGVRSESVWAFSREIRGSVCVCSSIPSNPELFGWPMCNCKGGLSLCTGHLRPLSSRLRAPCEPRIAQCQPFLCPCFVGLGRPRLS